MIRNGHPTTHPDPPLVMGEVTDPEELERGRIQSERFRRNLDWYQQHALELGETCRGKCICIAGQELFVADTPQEVLALAKTAHPEDNGFFLKYVYKERMPRIYAHWRG